MKQPEDLPANFERAWNAHNMTMFRALFHDDATFVNRFANFVRGVEEIVALHHSIHETIYRDSTLDCELHDLAEISEEVAIVHFWSRLTVGAAHPAGPHAIDTLIMAVMVRKNGAWRIQAAENVTLTDPRDGRAVLRNEIR